MVLFVNLESLEDESEPPEKGVALHWSQLNQLGGRDFAALQRFGGLNIEGAKTEDRINPNKNAVAEALGCYPIVIAIASHIDLNTLDALANTCRQIRANLLQFRTKLMTSTLHCENENIEPDPEHTFRYRARAADWYFVDTGRDAHGSGKVGNCARDMVGGCRRCARVVCRNCTIKPPAPILLKHRYRRLCKTCQKASLPRLMALKTCPQSTGCAYNAPIVITAGTLRRAVCTCPSEGVWLCQPCGRSVRNTDSDYEGVWKWRTRYFDSFSGIGVGIGEGDRGVECGLGGECLAAREVEQETDCDAEDAREFESNSRTVSPSSSPASTAGSVSSSGQMGPGYARHEIEGIGGRLKKKLVRMVKVGASVPDYEEDKTGKFLVREAAGKTRSWCGWCWRVVPGAKDTIE